MNSWASLLLWLGVFGTIGMQLVQAEHGKPALVLFRKQHSSLKNSRLQTTPIKLPIVPHHVTWSPPSNSWYKINTDGAVFNQLQATGIRIVTRDHEGHILAAMSKKLWVPLGPLEVEAKAMEEGIIFASDMGLQEVIF